MHANKKGPGLAQREIRGHPCLLLHLRQLHQQTAATRLDRRQLSVPALDQRLLVLDLAQLQQLSVTAALAFPSASATVFAASAWVFASSLRARSASWIACAFDVIAVAITAGTRGAPMKPNCCIPTPTGSIFCWISACTLARNSAFCSP